MSAPHFDSFEQFWPYYVREHSKKATRTLHAAGTGIGIGIAAYAAVRRRPRALWLAPIVGYGCSWIGHYFVEGNRPATFDYFWWSLRGDFRMLGKILAGTMDAEVVRVASEEAPRESAQERAGNGRAAHDHEVATSEPGNAN